MHMFGISRSVQRETGGNLAEILANLSTVIRERASLFMKVRALSSEGRMTAVMLTALPILAFVGLFLVNPAFYLDVAQDSMFIIGFVGLIVLRSEEHTSELQSLMRISYAVFCLKKKKEPTKTLIYTTII